MNILFVANTTQLCKHWMKDVAARSASDALVSVTDMTITFSDGLRLFFRCVPESGGPELNRLRGYRWRVVIEHHYFSSPDGWREYVLDSVRVA
jgi:hypothetical protein